MATIEKILNSFPGDESGKIRGQLAAVLAGVVSQRLLPKVGGGLVIAAEVMVPSAPIRAVIRDGALVQLGNVIQTTRQPGTVSFDRQLAQLLRDGLISPEDAAVNAQDPSTLESANKLTR